MSQDQKPKQQRRVKVDLPADVVAVFREVADRRKHTGSMLVYNAVITAARLARRGEFAFLPAKSSAPARSLPQKPIDFTQSAEESARCARELADGGSSVRAVVASYVAAYIEADGDVLELNWPLRRDVGRPAQTANAA